MHCSRKKLRRIAALMLTPLILCGAPCTEAAPAPAPQETAAAAATQVQQLSMEFRHPVADGILMRMICLMDAPVKNVFSTEELAAKELDPESFITCLGEFVGKAFANGRYVDI